MIILMVLGPPPADEFLSAPSPTLPRPPTAVLRHNDVRPCTCIIKPSRHPSALGYMIISNNTDSDAVAQLTFIGSKDTLVAGTIRAGETLTLTGIYGGLYSLYYGFGKDWDYTSNSFRREREYYRDREPFDYTRPYEHYWEVTLYTAPGLSGVDEISESEFPRIEASPDATPTPWGDSASLPRAPLLAAARHLPLARETGGGR